MKHKVSVRDMVLGAVIMLIGLAVGAVVSPPIIAQRAGVFGEIECTGLKVVDKHGKTAIELGSYESGNEVTLFDKSGKVGVVLGAIDGWANVVNIHDRSAGKPGIALQSIDQGNTVYVYDRSGSEKPGIYLQSIDQGNEVTLLDKSGKVGVNLAAIDGINGVSVHDTYGKARITLTTLDITDESNAAVSVLDQYRNIIWQAPGP